MALRATEPQELDDDLDLESLELSIRRSLATLERRSNESEINFGDLSMPLHIYRGHLKNLLIKLSEKPNKKDLFEYIHDNFEFREVYGDKDWSEALVTSYFEPVIQGSLTPTDKFSQPLYKLPSDLLKLDLNDFDPKWSSERKLRARIEGQKIVPYYSRMEIDTNGALQGRSLEICWVDPVDAFFLQIQGSGTVLLQNGKELRLNYAEKNGHPYKALGNYLKDVIPLSEMNLTNMQRYLRTLSLSELHGYFNNNPSYVFFTLSEVNAVTASGAPATPGRTIATDPRFFPKGSLVLLEFEKPVKHLDSDGKTNYTKEITRRFVMDQDTGGAITGGGRVDLFWGRGEEAGDLAGRVKSRGRVWYLVPKQSK